MFDVRLEVVLVSALEVLFEFFKSSFLPQMMLTKSAIVELVFHLQFVIII